MRIVVNNIAAVSGGAMTILKDFYTCVCEHDTENEWIFLLADKFFEETENVKIIALPEIKKSSVKKVIFDLFTGKKFIEKLNPDVVFSMQNIITFGLKVPQIIYLHQSIPFQTVKKFSFLKSSERKLAFIQYFIGFLIKLSVKKCDRVIVQTKWMKKAVCKSCGLKDNKVLQIMPNVKDFKDVKNPEKFDKTSFFYPTTNGIYKNNKCIFDACKILDGENIDYNVTLTISPEYSSDKIKCTGRIPYEEVLDLYNKSTLVFPSYIETIGLPMIEARKMGTIILASDCDFSHEALDGYENAYFFNQFNPEELAILMKKVIDGKIDRKETKDEIDEQGNSWKTVMNSVLALKKDNFD